MKRAFFFLLGFVFLNFINLHAYESKWIRTPVEIIDPNLEYIACRNNYPDLLFIGSRKWISQPGTYGGGVILCVTYS